VEFPQSFRVGFHKGHSTTQHILRLTEWTTRAFDLKKAIGAVFLDAEKAFDRVWHGVPVMQATRFGDSARPSKGTQVVPNQRVFNVRVGAALPSPCYLATRALQSSLLLPLLFALYTSGVLLPVHSQRKPPITPTIR
jgi:hypothetical protein